MWILEFSADKNGCDYYESRSLDEINDGLDVDDDDYDEYADHQTIPNEVGKSHVLEVMLNMKLMIKKKGIFVFLFTYD